jgi:hypothetical protein
MSTSPLYESTSQQLPTQLPRALPSQIETLGTLIY